MNTEQQTEEEVIASWFNEGEVMQWLKARASIYRMPGLMLRIDNDKEALACSAKINDCYTYAPNFDEAVFKLRDKLPSAVSLREQANVLLKQAAEIESANQEADELRTEGKKSLVKPNIHD